MGCTVSTGKIAEAELPSCSETHPRGKTLLESTSPPLPMKSRASSGFVMDGDHGMPLKPVVNLAVLGYGNCSYPEMLLPDPNDALRAFSRKELVFAVGDDASLKTRVGKFQKAVLNPLGVLSNPFVLPDHHIHIVSFYEKAEQFMKGEKTDLQGGKGTWDTDSFAADLVGHTFLASFLEELPQGGFVLDFTDFGTEPATTLQNLKRRAVKLAPKEILRCKGYLDVRDVPTLIKIDVQIEQGKTLTFRPTDGYKWGLAKVALHVVGGFVIACFHTGVHLFSHAIVAASQRALPESSTLNGLMDPQSLFVTAAMLEEATILHNDSVSAWNGSVWKCDIGQVRELTVAIARYFLHADVHEALGMSSGIQARPRWWAGGAAHFIEPIQSFATAVAQKVVAEKSRNRLIELQDQLGYVGVLDDSTLDVQTLAGLTQFYRNALFFQSVYHASMFHTREYLTPLGLPHSDKFVPYLSGSRVLPRGTKTPCAINAAFASDSEVIKSTFAWAAIIYGTAGGIDGPELGDGDFFNSDGLDVAISTFRRQVDGAREAAYKQFEGSSGGFVPLCFFPKVVKKEMAQSCPLTQTTYV